MVNISYYRYKKRMAEKRITRGELYKIREDK